jgi:hypothetical protein
MANELTKMMEMRNRYLEQHANKNPILVDTIPNIAKNLFSDQFGICFQNAADIPIVFIIGWKHILKFLKDQPDDEFALETCGVSIEYVTEYSESDKSRNIVPQMFHKRTPIFVKQNHVHQPGYKIADEQLERYNIWRTENLTETISKIESEVFAHLNEEFGIDLMTSAAVFPLMSAVYTAGVTVARDTKQPINMYNIFEIRIAPDETIILKPLAEIKQSLKSDTVKTSEVPF